MSSLLDIAALRALRNRLAAEADRHYDRIDNCTYFDAELYAKRDALADQINEIDAQLEARPS